MTTQQRPRRPRRCGRCTMFGHDRRNCHYRPYTQNHGTPQEIYDWTMNNWRNHCDINAQWVAQGGAGHDVPEPQQPKTPFEQACDNTCKVTHTDDCCICMEALGEKNTATTACGHQFHFGCLAQHTGLSDKCPMCRAVICPDMPKKALDLPTERDIARYGVRAAGPMGAVLGELANLNNNQVTMITEALAQVLVDTNLMVLNRIRQRNQ